LHDNPRIREDARGQAKKRPRTAHARCAAPTEESGVDRLTGQPSADAAIETHAALLRDIRLTSPANAAQRAHIVRDIQQNYGNQHLRHVIDRVQRKPEERPSHAIGEQGTISLKGEGPVAAEEALAKEIKDGLKSAKEYLDEAKSVLEKGQKLSGLDFGKAVGALGKVSGNLGKAAKYAGRAESVFKIANSVSAFDTAWNNYMSNPSRENLQKLQQGLDSTLGVFKDSAGVLNGLVPGIGDYISKLLDIGKKLTGGFTKALAREMERVEEAAKGGETPPPKKPEGLPPTPEAKPGRSWESEQKAQKEFEREKYRTGIKPTEVGTHVANQLYWWSQTTIGYNPPDAVRQAKTKELAAFVKYYAEIVRALIKLETLGPGKWFLHEAVVYKDKIRWGADEAMDALRRLARAIEAYDSLGPTFAEDIKALAEIKAKHPPEKSAKEETRPPKREPLSSAAGQIG